jgi:acetyl-CoA carboxylase biotin carboxyl carrier protein
VDLKQIEKLMLAMEQSRIKRVVLKREDFEIEIERECAIATPAFTPPLGFIPTPTPAPPIQKISVEPAQSLETQEKPSGHYVTSPMVGTFYASPSPEDPPFVKVGDSVSDDTVVCIIEAMKVMNEVKAGIKGTVLETYLKSGEPVEFGTHIFKIGS